MPSAMDRLDVEMVEAMTIAGLLMASNAKSRAHSEFAFDGCIVLANLRNVNHFFV